MSTTQFWVKVLRSTGETVTLLVLMIASLVIGIILEARFSISIRRDLPLLTPAVDLVLGKPLSEAELLDIEIRTQSLGKSISPVGPFFWRLKLSDGKPTPWNAINTVTGYHVLVRRAPFFITAGHKGAHLPEEKKFVYGFKQKDGSIIESETVYFTEIRDLEIILLPRTPDDIVPLQLDGDLSDLKNRTTPLFVICNPALHFRPVRTGFFYGFIPFAREYPGYLQINFPGIGVEPGCSGAPVIGLDRMVKGTITRLNGQAIPSTTILTAIEKAFFSGT